MKKTILILALIISTFAFAQQEVKLNIGNALILKTIDISYEHYIDNQSSFGITGLYNFEKITADFRYNEDKIVTPYFRHYFTADRNWNVFGEGFFSISSGRKETGLVDDAEAFKTFTDGALGIAAGLKYVSDNGLVVDIFGGIGRNLFSSNSPIIVPRAGINVGWRF